MKHFRVIKNLNFAAVLVIFCSIQSIAQSGIFYTSEDLARWKNRAANGPFKLNGDAFKNSPGDWNRMVNDAKTFLNSDRHNLVWEGPGQITDGQQVNDPLIGSSNALKYTRMMTAAFVDLVLDTDDYKPHVKQILLEQAQTPGTDFSDKNIYRGSTYSGNTDAMWTFAEWQIKFLRAYDYLGEDYFTAEERQIMEKWFKDGAEWQEILVTSKSLDKLYNNERGIPIGDYVLNPAYSEPGGLIYRDGPRNYRHGNWHNNRRVGQIYFVTYAGVLIDDESMKKQGASAFKEWLAFHWYPDGYPMELHRSTSDRPQGGLGYVPNTVTGYTEIAHVLHLDGYENLFEYSTNVYINPASGAKTQGSENKTLEWVILQMRKNFMEADARKIYPAGSSGTSTDILMHYCLASPTTGTFRHRPHPSQSSSIANSYYKNSQIREIYWPTGSICGFPSNPTSMGSFNGWNGVGGALPGYMFMFAQPNGSSVTVYLDAGGNASVTADTVGHEYYTECEIDSFSLSKTNFSCEDLGPNLLALSAIDSNGNINNATATITVKDTIKPIAFTKDTIIYVDANGNASISAEDVDNGSFDNCGKESFSLSKLITCNDVGVNSVTLTVTDASGNYATSQFKITVRDTIAPVAICEEREFYLDKYGRAIFYPSDLEGESYDNCGIGRMWVSPDRFSCSKTGENIVTLTVEDHSGNRSTCNSIFTVLDTLPPIIETIDSVKIELGSNDFETKIDYPEIKVTDNCSFVLEQIEGLGPDGIFPVGTTTETWIATDENGNTTTASFKVFVEDYTVGSSNMAMNKFEIQLYPNPTSAIVTVHITPTSDQWAEVTVTNILGEKVLHKRSSANKKIILDMSGSASGMYFLKINFDGKSLLKKLILNRFQEFNFTLNLCLINVNS